MGLCMRAFRWASKRLVAGSPNTPHPTPLTLFSSPSPRLTSQCRRWGHDACSVLSLDFFTQTPHLSISLTPCPLSVYFPLYMCKKSVFQLHCSLNKRYIIQEPSPSNGRNLQRYHFCDLLYQRPAVWSHETDPKFTSRTLKDGYESDSTLSYRKHCYTPTNSGPSPQAKALYTQVPLQRQKAIQARVSHFLKVQKGGDVPLQGLRMQVPEKKGKPGKNCMPTPLLCCCTQIVMRKYVSRFDHWHAGG